MEESNICTNNELKDDDNKENDIIAPYLSAFWHGLGLFGESYLLFSVGTLRPLWEALYPTCFDTQNATTCTHPYLTYKSITYAVVLGVMAGMIVLGILANTIGRRRGSIITASIMAFGAVCLTLSSIFLSGDPEVLFPVMSLSLFVFGVGVGGEYPLSASSASERAMVAMKRRRRIELDHEEKMKRLLMSPSHSGGENPTPIRGNLSKSYNNDEYGRQDSMLQVYTNMSPRSPTGTTSTTTTTPWQTLESKAPSVVASNNNSNNHNHPNVGNAQHSAQLTPVVEESYGDVPLSPTNQTDNNSLSTYNSSLRTRGRDVLLVFSMQGMGILANSLILTFLLMVARKNGGEQNGGDENNNNNDDYDYDGAGDNYDADANYEPSTLLNIWRITYATGAGILIYVLVSRISHLTESEVWAEDRDQREEERRERCHREAGVGFRPPHHHPTGGEQPPQPYDNNDKRKADSENNDNDGEASKQGQPVISPTMSSITMKSEFDLLGSTNLDGCKIVPAVMTESDDDDSRGGGNKRKRSSEEMLLFRHYGVRLFGTSVTWLLWDIAYYGNKLFQSSFLIALTGEDASLVDIMGASAVNAFVALLGYYAAAAIVDDPDCGRLALQQTGFIITGTLFLLCGCLNERLSSTWLVVMYFGSSFFGQCGPNCTTFLIPCEVFPTNMRAMCHGISASAGKLGALIASILFNFVGERELFLFSGYASFAASLITFLTIPETTTLDLYEIDKQWHKVLNNERYEGPATDPRHLSFYERNQNRFCCSQ